MDKIRELTNEEVDEVKSMSLIMIEGEQARESGKDLMLELSSDYRNCIAYGLQRLAGAKYLLLNGYHKTTKLIDCIESGSKDNIDTGELSPNELEWMTSHNKKVRDNFLSVIMTMISTKMDELNSDDNCSISDKYKSLCTYILELDNSLRG